MSLSPQFLDELRSRTLLSALIGRTTKLQKAGREYRACCPFHNEKTPSFYVNDDKGFYHCFGCSAHGDAIRWLTDQRGLPFMDAVKELAQAAGMDLPAPDPRAAEKAEAARGLHEACADAAQWFTDQLNGIAGAEARTLLDRRGIKPETARAFGLGFAPNSRSKLKDALKEYGDPLLVEAGLLIAVEDKVPYDRFRGRLMIPIRDPRGRTIAFGGRIIGDGEPKYLNSPETPLFDKGRTLYNLDRAAPAARKAGRVLVVEGYMDVIALAQAGFDEAVAPLGTALTEHQLDRIWRMSDAPILCFDGDAAGQKAALRAVERAMPLLTPERSLSVASLPKGQDPDDLIHSDGRQAFENLLRSAASIEDTIWNAELVSNNVGSPNGRALIKQRLEEWASKIAHADLSYQYKRALLSRYFDVFGIKRANVEKLREAVSQAYQHRRRGLDYSLKRSILLGLMRHPSVIAQRFDELSKIDFGDRYLNRWKYHLLQIAMDYDVLTESLVDQILAQTDVAPIERRDYQRDLAFSFYRASSEAEVACDDLRRVIDIVLAENEAKQDLDIARRAFETEMTEATFDMQRRCHMASIRTHEMLAEWLEQAVEASEAA